MIAVWGSVRGEAADGPELEPIEVITLGQAGSRAQTRTYLLPSAGWEQGSDQNTVITIEQVGSGLGP